MKPHDPERTLVLIFRSPRKAYSIERIFHRMAQLCRPRYRVVEFFYDERKSLLRNCLDLRRIQGDVYHVTGDVNYLVSALVGRKTVLTVHDIGVYKSKGGVRKFLLGLIWFRIPFFFAMQVTAVSDYTKRDLARFFGVAEQRVAVVHNPIKNGIVFKDRSVAGGSKKILQVGTAVHKNVGRLIESVQGLEVTLWFVGRLSADDRKRMESQGTRFEEFIDVDDVEIARLYQQCDLVSFVSLHEGFGLPVIEANAAGAPVVASNVCSIPEVAGDAAMLVDPHNVAEIRQAIVAMLGETKIRDEYVARGRKNALRFDEETVARSYLQLYDNLCGAPR